MTETQPAQTGEETTAEMDAQVLLGGWEAAPASHPTRHAQVKWAARTDIGRTRENNEDKFDFFLPDDEARLARRGRLWAVADGMGGHAAGQVASEVALKTLVRTYFDVAGPDEPEAALRASVLSANALLFHAAKQFGEKYQGMGTTLVALVVHEGTAFVAHVGDSRVYLLRDGEPIRQITTDHSWVEEQVRRGNLSRADAEASPYRNYILRSVGVEEKVEPDTTQVPVRPGDTFLLCSDGLTGHLDDSALEAIITNKSCSQAALDLIDAANAGGGRDNITALVLRVVEMSNWAGGEQDAA